MLKLRVVGEAAKPGDLRLMLASFASIWLCMEPTDIQGGVGEPKANRNSPPIAGLRRAVMGSDLAICCKTVMKKRIWTWVECWRRLYRAAVRSASDKTLNP